MKQLFAEYRTWILVSGVVLIAAVLYLALSGGGDETAYHYPGF